MLTALLSGDGSTGIAAAAFCKAPPREIEGSRSMMARARLSRKPMEESICCWAVSRAFSSQTPGAGGHSTAPAWYR